MIRIIEFYLLVFIIINSINCGDEPIPPCIDCPQPSDTTSHDFGWTIDTLGDAISQLNDVAILNDGTIICVGRMYLNDSNGQLVNSPYCIAKYNGIKWELKRIYSTDNILISEIRGILAFSATDIWLTDGAVNRWDGSSTKASVTFDRISLIGGEENGQSVNKLWGPNSNNLYGIGWKGMLAHYNGANWQKITTGTTLDIQDIWGSVDSKTGEQQVVAVASNKFLNEGKKLLQITNTTAITINDSGLSWNLSGIWFEANKQYYIVGGGLYNKSSISIDKRWQTFHQGLTTYYANAIRANSWNDIVVVGAFGNFLHYNGSSWKNYLEIELPAINGSYYSVAIKNNFVVAVGDVGDKAIVVKGKRK